MNMVPSPCPRPDSQSETKKNIYIKSVEKKKADSTVFNFNAIKVKLQIHYCKGQVLNCE